LFGGGALDMTISAGGAQVVYGTATSTVIDNGGIEIVGASGQANATTVSSGGTLDVLVGGSASAPNLLPGATLLIGGSLAGFTISSGITLEVSAGSVNNTTVLSGGTLELLDGAAQSGTTISSGGILEIGFGETLSGYRASGGVTLEASFGGNLSSTTILIGGTLDLLSGGVANGVTVSGGGTAQFASGAVVSGPNSISASGHNATLLVEAQIVTVSSGGVVLGSGAQLNLELGQVSGALTVASGATVNALNGANILVATSGKIIANAGLISVQNGATLTLSGTVSNTTTLFANGGTLDLAGVVKGGTTLIGNGIADIQQASSENVTFQLGGTGGVELDIASVYTGKVTGFGSNSNQFIDFTHINSAGATIGYTSKSSNSGVLTVTSGGHIVASVSMVGHYTTPDFTPSNDGSGHLEITDPPVVEQKPGNAPATIAAGTVLEVKVPDSGAVTFAGPTGTLWLDKPLSFTGKLADFGAQETIDLPSIPFGLHTTLGYSENSSDTGGILSVKEGTHIAKIALLGNYMATSFVTAADGHGGTLITEAAQTASQLAPLTTPHTG
jgi:autotransporter passenger strand-loop-strand repeat protein